MFKKTFVGLAALAATSAANAGVTLNFNGATGNLGTTHTYTNGSYSVTATGYLNASTTALFGKNNGGDENGLGLNRDPSGDHEIWYDGQNTDFVQLDMNNILSTAMGATFFMGSSTSGEGWAVYGSNTAGSLGTWLMNGSDESNHGLADWGQFRYYDFVATGTHTCGWWGCSTSAGNVLLGGLSIQPVPEPKTWAMMLLGFGAIGFAARRQRKVAAQVA